MEYKIANSKMKVVYGYPPNWERIKAAFPDINEDTVLITYGDTIYQPGDHDIAFPIICHEEVHARQQGDDPAGWWDRYLKDPHFRLNQEIEAYAEQHRVFCKRERDRNARAEHLFTLARQLSGPTYAAVCSFPIAHRLIRQATSA